MRGTVRGMQVKGGVQQQKQKLCGRVAVHLSVGEDEGGEFVDRAGVRARKDL